MAQALRIAAVAAILVLCGGGAPGSAQTVQTEHGPVQVEKLAGLVEPWGMAFLPDGRLLITEKPGRLRIYDAGTLSDPIRGVPAVAPREQGGLLDVEIDPEFGRNRRVYLSYAEAADPQPEEAPLEPDPRLGAFVDKDDAVLKGAAVARGRLDGSQLRDVEVIWRQVPKTIGLGHFGGRLVFAADGTLFITSGERQRFEPAQDLGSNLGKIVRINRDGSVPRDNPFADEPGALPEIWTLGHRNPLGAAFDPVTQQLWVNEMGPAGGDELNRIERGRNYGWPNVSNGDHYDGTPIPDHGTHPKEYAAPAASWNPSVSPSGLIFYTGRLFPGWQGDLLMGGLSSKALIRLSLDGDRVRSVEFIDLRQRIRDVIQAPDGAVLVATDAEDGALLRLTPAPKP